MDLKGVVPLLMLNLQRGVAAGEEMPDAWHHQMVYGVDSEHIHVCNPVTVTTSDVIEQQLCSESVLKVKISTNVGSSMGNIFVDIGFA